MKNYSTFKPKTSNKKTSNKEQEEEKQRAKKKKKQIKLDLNKFSRSKMDGANLASGSGGGGVGSNLLSSAAGPSTHLVGESMKLTARQKSASSSKSSINSENLYTKNLTFLQLFKRSILKNVLLVSTIVAVFMGFSIGMIMRHSHQGAYSSEVITLIAFPGDMFLRMLKMLILPLIIASVISALASLDSTVSGKIGMRACMFYMTTTVVATITGIILVTLLHPGDVHMKAGFERAGKQINTHTHKHYTL